MVNTDKIIGYYTDCFGNEFPEYEQITKYTVSYKGFLFEGDKKDGYNYQYCDTWEEAISLFYTYGEDKHLEMEITDNEYGVSFDGEDWY